jgi:hypothetical protein
MERETKTVETPAQKKAIVLNTYLTGREYEFVQEPLLQAMQIKPGVNGKETQLGALDVSKVQESSHRLIEKFVVSVDGKTDGILDAVLDMHQEDYQFIITTINDLSKKN